jgi:hypothetical protein
MVNKNYKVLGRDKNGMTDGECKNGHRLEWPK